MDQSPGILKIGINDGSCWGHRHIGHQICLLIVLCKSRAWETAIVRRRGPATASMNWALTSYSFSLIRWAASPPAEAALLFGWQLQDAVGPFRLVVRLAFLHWHSGLQRMSIAPPVAGEELCGVPDSEEDPIPLVRPRCLSFVARG